MKNYRLLSLAAATLTLASCSKNTDNASAASAKLEVRLTDAPGNFQSVVLDVQ